MSVFDTAIFKRLQADWYRVLERDGFKDHESMGGYLRGTEKRTWDRAIQDREKREAYFERAADVLHKFKFQTELEREIWELHAGGLSTRRIGAQLNTPAATVKWKIKQIRMQVRLEGHWKKLRSGP